MSHDVELTAYPLKLFRKIYKIKYEKTTLLYIELPLYFKRCLGLPRNCNWFIVNNLVNKHHTYNIKSVKGLEPFPVVNFNYKKALNLIRI